MFARGVFSGGVQRRQFAPGAGLWDVGLIFSHMAGRRMVLGVACERLGQERLLGRKANGKLPYPPGMVRNSKT